MNGSGAFGARRGLLFSALFFLTSCSMLPDRDPVPPLDLDRFEGHWIYSFEEDNADDGVEPYRPSDYAEFPPLHFRMAYIFNDDRTCSWMYLDPADAHHFRDCTWRVEDGSDRVIRVDRGERIERFRIVELSDDFLLIERLDEKGVIGDS